MQQGIILVRYYKNEQDYQHQLEELRTLAHRMTIQVNTEIVERIGDTYSRWEPGGIDQLLQLSRQQLVQQVFIKEISRLGRSTDEIRYMIDELTKLGVSIFVQNLGIETLLHGQPNPAAGFLIPLLDELNRLEVETLRQRIRACLRADRRQPAKTLPDEQSLSSVYLTKYPKVVNNLRAGISLRQTAKLCNVSVNTARKVNAYLF